MLKRPAVRDLQLLIDRTPFQEKPSVLEAGAGAKSHVELPDDSYMVGIDISADQLDRNPELAVRIVGDLQTHEYEVEAYDVIVCWDVLEHLDRPQLALAGFERAVKPEGLIVVATPNIRALKPLVAKFTPHWFHVWIYKHIFGNPNAGKEDYGPFPTYMRKAGSPRSLKAFAKRKELSVIFYQEYDAMIPSLKEKSKPLYYTYVMGAHLLRLVSLGTLGGMSNSDYIIVLKKSRAAEANTATARQEAPERSTQLGGAATT